jgi:hypothetical protein
MTKCQVAALHCCNAWQHMWGWTNMCITTNKLCPTLLTGKGCTMAMTEELGCLKLYAHLAQQMSRDPQHRQGNKSPVDLLDQHNTSGEVFLVQSFANDKTWIHHSEPEFIWQSMEWCHTPPRMKQINCVPSEGKITTTDIWDKRCCSCKLV